MTLRADHLTTMLARECAAADWFQSMSKADQRKYLRDHPHSKYAHGASRGPSVDDAPARRPSGTAVRERVATPAPRGDAFLRTDQSSAERERHRAAITAHLRALADQVACRPAHARALHGVITLADAAHDSGMGAPVHERELSARLRRYTENGLPGGDDVPEHPEHGAHVQMLTDGARAAVRRAGARDADFARIAQELRGAVHHLRLGGHLQRGNLRRATDHVQTMSPADRQLLPGRVRRLLARKRSAN